MRSRTDSENVCEGEGDGSSDTQRATEFAFGDGFIIFLSDVEWTFGWNFGGVLGGFERATHRSARSERELLCVRRRMDVLVVSGRNGNQYFIRRRRDARREFREGF